MEAKWCDLLRGIIIVVEAVMNIWRRSWRRNNIYRK